MVRKHKSRIRGGFDHASWSADGKLLMIATEDKQQGDLEITYLSVHEWDRQSGETRLLIEPAAFAASRYKAARGR